jgi:uncharacterized protein (DUF885 family)
VQSIDRFHESAFAELILEVPELPLELGVSEVGGLPVPTDSFTDYSEEAAERRRNRMVETLAALRAFPLDRQTPQQRLTSRVFEFFLEYASEGALLGVRGHAFALEDQPLRPGFGVQTQLPILLAALHPVNDRRGAEDYLCRLSRFPGLFGQLLEGLRLREARQNVLPRALLAKTLDELRGFVASPACENPLYTSLAHKLGESRGLGGDAGQGLLERAEREIERSVYPAYARLGAFLEDQLERAPEQPGLCRLPDGEAYYDFLLKSATTVETGAEEVHQLGLRELAGLEARLDAAFAGLGHGEGSVAERCRALDEDPRFRRPRSQGERARIIDDLRKTIADAEARLGAIFGRLPRAGVVAEPVPGFCEENRHHGYKPPARDGSRPGVFEVNVSSALEDSTLDTLTVCYHEAIPGHHLQFSIAQELEGLPALRRMITFDAYIEGWAKYAETLPWEHGWSRDPYWNLARMRRELVSTANLALDTGIHHKGWTRDEGLRFFMERTGSSAEFSAHIVDRIAGDPAQTCSYKIGMLAFLELRERMREAFGDDFDLRRFHDAVLENGSLPIGILGDVVDEAISAAGGQV